MSVNEVDELIKYLGLTEREVLRATRRALNSTMNQLTNLIKREIGQSTGVKEKLIRQRMIRYRSIKKWVTTLLMFTNEIPAIITASPQKLGSGIKVGSKFYPNSFLAKADRHGKGKARDFIFFRKTMARTPLLERKINIDATSQSRFIAVQSGIKERFLNNFARELMLFGGVFKK